MDENNPSPVGTDERFESVQSSLQDSVLVHLVFPAMNRWATVPLPLRGISRIMQNRMPSFRDQPSEVRSPNRQYRVPRHAMASFRLRWSIARKHVKIRMTAPSGWSRAKRRFWSAV